MLYCQDVTFRDGSDINLTANKFTRFEAEMFLQVLEEMEPNPSSITEIGLSDSITTNFPTIKIQSYFQYINRTIFL